MAEASIRDARPQDRPALVRMMAALQDFEREFEPNRTPGPEMADSHLAVLEEWAAEPPCGGVVVAEAGGALVGFILFGATRELGTYVPVETRTLGSISELWVDPEARGGGVASALIAAAEARFRAAGLTRVEISTLDANAPALRLYGALGFGPYLVTLAKTL